MDHTNQGYKGSLLLTLKMNTVIPWHRWWIGLKTPADVKIPGCSSLLYKIEYAYNLCIHPPVYFIKIYLIQYKCYVNSCPCMVNLAFAFWNFLEISSLPPNIFSPWLIESD